jgi:hypothetical protein
MNIVEFEQKIFELEGVRIIVRAESSEQLGDYSYQKKYDQGNSINDWLKSRVLDKVGAFDVVVVDGSGALPNRKTHMGRLRDSYAE